MEEAYKPVVQPQRRLNPNIKEVVKKEVMKLLNVGIIYPISDNPWASPMQVVPKKGGMIVVPNDKGQLIPTQTITGWRVCIDYRRLNDATRKDHHPLHFIDQCLSAYPVIPITAFWTGCLVTSRYPLIRKIKKRLPLPVPMVRSCIVEYHLVCRMCLRLFKAVWWPFLMT